QCLPLVVTYALRLFRSATALRVSFFCRCYRSHRALHSFPTRRSSDLLGEFDNFLKPYKSEKRERSRGENRRHSARRGLHQINRPDRKSTRLNSSHVKISYAVFCLKKKNNSAESVPNMSASLVRATRGV